jgi:hypothetical protein
MSDWRQIQARIRKAKSAADPVVQLSALYERTRDAMVAFELARHHEKIGENQEAARWYTSAAERFRRAQWKVKAQEALIRLGAPIPTSSPIPESVSADHSQPEASPSTEPETEHGGPADESTVETAISATEVSSPSERLAAPGKKRRRRGRRGGRGRRRGTAGKPELTATTPEARGELRSDSRGEPAATAVTVPVSARPAAIAPRAAALARSLTSRPESGESISDPHWESASLQLRGRTGDPGLSSRMAHLESQLRRLLACAPVSLDQADQAPAGPGVFIVADSDQITYYYVEACQTLRIGIANLLRADRAGTIRRTQGDSLREKFAEHLEINESKVSKYLKDHCSVRWIQLDEGARLLAHFAIAVLRPSLND